MKTIRLQDIAKTIRSKNAGVDKITFDILCRDRKDFDLLRKSGSISRQSISKLFSVSDNLITDFVEFEPANAIKFTLVRRLCSGGPGDSDIFGSQQYGPLFDIQIEVPDDWRPTA
jgi:hypothetical protein